MPNPHTDLDAIDQQAENLLDGITVNRAKFAREIQRATRELRELRSPTIPPPEKPGSFSHHFGEVFDDLLGRRGK